MPWTEKEYIPTVRDIAQIHLLLGNFECKKSLIKKLMNFSEKIHWQFKTTLHLLPKHLRRHFPLKIHPDFDLL